MLKVFVGTKKREQLRRNQIGTFFLVIGVLLIGNLLGISKYETHALSIIDLISLTIIFTPFILFGVATLQIIRIEIDNQAETVKIVYMKYIFFIRIFEIQFNELEYSYKRTSFSRTTSGFVLRIFSPKTKNKIKIKERLNNIDKETLDNFEKELSLAVVGRLTNN